MLLPSDKEHVLLKNLVNYQMLLNARKLRRLPQITHGLAVRTTSSGLEYHFYDDGSKLV